MAISTRPAVKLFLASMMMPQISTMVWLKFRSQTNMAISIRLVVKLLLASMMKLKIFAKVWLKFGSLINVALSTRPAVKWYHLYMTNKLQKNL